MGVLGDDDIEKLVEANKKSRRWKGFEDPKKAKNAFDIMYLIALFGIMIGGVGWIVTDAQLTNANEDIVSLNEWNTELSHRTDILTNLIIDNADCPTLIAMYHDDKLDQLKLWKKVIKDEIAFRC